MTADEKGELEFQYMADKDLPGNILMIENSDSGIEFGDADERGNVDLKDANLILKSALGIETMTERTSYIADIDMDAAVTLSDANLALKNALGIK